MINPDGDTDPEENSEFLTRGNGGGRSTGVRLRSSRKGFSSWLHRTCSDRVPFWLVLVLGVFVGLALFAGAQLSLWLAPPAPTPIFQVIAPTAINAPAAGTKSAVMAVPSGHAQVDVSVARQEDVLATSIFQPKPTAVTTVIAEKPGSGASATVVASDSNLPLSRRPLLFDWSSMQSAYHNFGRPSVRLVCQSVETIRERGEYVTQSNLQLHEHTECERLRDAEAAAESRGETVAEMPSDFFAKGTLRAGVYEFSPIDILRKVGGSIVVYFPHPTGSGSQGHYSMTAIANELKRIGFPAYMYYMTGSTGWIEKELDNNIPNGVNWMQDPRVGEDPVVVSAEGNGSAPKEAPHFRNIKWHLGWHTSPGAQMEAALLNVCWINYFSTVFKCPRSTQMMAGLTPAILNAAREYKSHLEPGRPKKERLVMWDNDMGWDLGWIQQQLPGVKFQKLEGMSREQTLDVYRRTSVTVDFGLPGSEAINGEGVMFDAVTIVGRSKAGVSLTDFPFPERYHVDQWNNSEVVEVIRDALDNYEDRVKEFHYYKQLSLNMDHLFRRDLATNFHARSVLFYIYAPSLASLIGALATVVSFKHVFPMARFELLTCGDPGMIEGHRGPLWWELRDHLAWVTLRRLPGHLDKRPLNPLHLLATPPQTSQATAVYTVFLTHSSTLATGVDFVNEHIKRLEASGDTAIATHRPGQPNVLDDSLPIIADTKKYWAAVGKVGESEANSRLASASALLSSAGIPLRSPLAAKGEVPLPLDLIVIHETSYTATFYLTRSLHLPLVTKEDLSKHPLRPELGEVPDQIFSLMRVRTPLDTPDPVRTLIERLMHSPLWRSIEIHLPEIFQVIRDVV